VNTVLVRGSGASRGLVGSNTDWLGSNRALEQAVTLRDSHALILGAGGAARAVGFGLIEAGARVSLASRTEASGRVLAGVLGCDWYPLDGEPVQADILINATSVGMQPHEEQSPFPAGRLPGFTAVMDIVYAPLQTRLLREAEESGCRTITGLEMLLFQGAAQFETWTKVTAPLEVMRAALLGAVSG
jgi:shikimate dehydrogenase